MSTETNTNEKDEGGFELTSEQLDVLMQHKQIYSAGHEATVVPESTAKVIDRLDLDPESLAGMSNPKLVDAGPTDTEALREIADACRRLNDPVVVEQSDAESLDAARDGLATIVSSTTGIDSDTADSMSVAALSSAVKGTAKAASSSSVATLDDLNQQPETGGTPESEALEANEPRGVDALSLGERKDLKRDLATYDRAADRTPQYAERVKDDLIDGAPGVDSIDELREAL